MLVLYGAAVLALILWGFFASFRTYASISKSPWKIFSDLSFKNYIGVFNDFKTIREYDGGFRTIFFEKMFLNSLLYAGGGALCQTLCTAVVAYCTSRYDKIGRAHV